MFCSTMLLILLNGSQWEFRDLSKVRSAANTCKVKYKSCLKKITKVKSGTYRAICK